jgi:hypothetical protein
MKAAPTLDGRLRIDLESDTDLMVLRSAPLDARLGSDRLMERLGEGMTGEIGDDWRDFVLPDLREQFDGQLKRVVEILGDAEVGRPVFVDAAAAEAWYGTFNQARLALEERFQIAGEDDLATMENERRAAAIRSRAYATLQSLILGCLMDRE